MRTPSYMNWPRIRRASQQSRLGDVVMRLGADPRHFQIAVLGSLLLYGISVLSFPVGLAQVAVLLGSALATQVVVGLAVGSRFDLRSPLITVLALCLLLRSNDLAVLALGAVLAIASKAVIRWRGKHVFNPANLGLISAVLLTDKAWLSPGQWGSAASLGLVLVCAGGLVVYRAARADVTLAFLVSYSAILFGRSAWLGDPWPIPVHALNNGALLLFAFFMISDPKTTPNSRFGRIVYAALVAGAAGTIHFVLFRPNGFFYALFLCAPLVPCVDRLFGGRKYEWGAASRIKTDNNESNNRRGYSPMSDSILRPARALGLLAFAVTIVLSATAAHGFCGFYVAKADTKLFNQASQVVLVRDGDRTVLTMANDFKGDPQEFAVVIPVPTFIERGQIHVTNQSYIDHLDAYTSPRLVEYHDANPCWVRRRMESARQPVSLSAGAVEAEAREDRVTIEAKYTVGEYDILILSAAESSGLESWLRDNDYRIPDGATRVLDSYLKQGMRFFVAKVNLSEQAKLGYANLRPLQVAYESPKFMLPIRLGTVNADGPQELFVYALTRKGRVETTNYRTVKLPTGMDLPVFIKHDFDDFYRDMFSRQVEKERGRGVFLEYAWDMSWCDPCAADPLSVQELRELGVFWVQEGNGAGQARDAFATRLHVRYDREHFPEDLHFQETADRSNFQGRYVLRHPFQGDIACSEADGYRRQLLERHEREATTLASLTGWEVADIRSRMGIGRNSADPTEARPARSWWERLWSRGL